MNNGGPSVEIGIRGIIVECKVLYVREKRKENGEQFGYGDIASNEF